MDHVDLIPIISSTVIFSRHQPRVAARGQKSVVLFKHLDPEMAPSAEIMHDGCTLNSSKCWQNCTLEGMGISTVVRTSAWPKHSASPVDYPLCCMQMFYQVSVSGGEPVKLLMDKEDLRHVFFADPTIVRLIFPLILHCEQPTAKI